MEASGEGNEAHDPLVASTHGALARCLSRALVVAFDACADAGMPLSKLQRIAFVESALLEFDGLALHIASVAAVNELLNQLEES